MKNHLAPGHIKTLRESLKGHPREALFTVALVTGLRPGELLRLAWQDLDLEQRQLQVQNTKTKSGSRRISLPVDVVELLKCHQNQQVMLQSQTGAAWQDHGLIFTDDDGEALQLAHLLKDWHALLEQAALPQFPFHEVRASVRRALLASMMPELSGHEASATTLETYSHGEEE
jgi:integrase